MLTAEQHAEQQDAEEVAQRRVARRAKLAQYFNEESAQSSFACRGLRSTGGGNLSLSITATERAFRSTILNMSF